MNEGDGMSHVWQVKEIFRPDCMQQKWCFCHQQHFINSSQWTPDTVWAAVIGDLLLFCFMLYLPLLTLSYDFYVKNRCFLNCDASKSTCGQLMHAIIENFDSVLIILGFKCLYGFVD